MLLCRPVDVLEQASRADVREPRIGSTLTSRMRDMSSVRPRSAIELPAMLWPPPLMLSNRPWSRANPTAAATSAPEVGWTTSAGAGDHAVPDQHGVVPARVVREAPETLDPRVELVELLLRQPHETAVESGDVDGAAFIRRPSVRRAGEPLTPSLRSCRSSRSAPLRRYQGRDWRDSANSVAAC